MAKDTKPLGNCCDGALMDTKKSLTDPSGEAPNEITILSTAIKDVADKSNSPLGNCCDGAIGAKE
tara:strand:- start:258 stop:452 length:195 start_codon:yes stop_codon:yes gene_type:complete